MVAIIAGSGLGLFESSATQLKGAGVLGQNGLGRSGGHASVNITNGNLLLQFTDETLSGSGADIRASRSYNAQGDVTDGDGDRWRWLGEKRVRLVGDRNAVGSWIIRTTGDGHEAIFVWNGSVYASSEGAGADDTMVWTGSEWEWTEGSSRVKETYDQDSGWITTSRDPSGNGFDYTFDNSVDPNRLTRVHDIRSGQVMEYVYNSEGFVSQVNTRLSLNGTVTEQVRYRYDSLGRLTSVSTNLEPGSSSAVYTTFYGYDGNSHRIASVSANGTDARYTYRQVNGEYRVETVTDQGGTTTFAYEEGLTRVTNGVGNTTVYEFDSEERLTRVLSEEVSGITQSMSYQYDEKSNVTHVRDGYGRVTTYIYDDRSNLIRELDHFANNTLYSYNAKNELVVHNIYVDNKFNTTRYAYDTAGRLRFTVGPDGQVSENRYDSRGLLSKTILYTQAAYPVAGMGGTASVREEQMNLWVSQQDLSQIQVTDYLYDQRGNLREQTAYGDVNNSGEGVVNGRASTTRYVYNAHGELLQTFKSFLAEGVDMEVESRVYDGMGRVIQISSNKGTQTISYDADSLGGAIVVKRDEVTGLNETEYYTPQGRLIATSRSAPGISRFSNYFYDDAGRVERVENAADGQSYVFYDAASRVSHRVSEAGRVIAYQYDANGLVTEERYYATVLDTSNWRNNRPATVTVANHNDDRVTTYEYDRGRLVRVREAFREAFGATKERVTETSYNSASWGVGKTVGGDRSTRLFYDSNGRSIGSLDEEGYLTALTYDKAGRLIRTVRYGHRTCEENLTSDFATIKAEAESDTRAEQLSTHYFYDGQGRQVGMVDEQGFLTETLYTTLVRRTSTPTAEWFTQTRRYFTPVVVEFSDTLSSVKSRAGTSLSTSTYFDQYGRKTREQSADFTEKRWFYDDNGRLTREINASGTIDQTATRWRYNALGEVTGVVSGVGEVMVSDLNQAIDQYGTRFTYDGMGRKTAEYGPEGQKTLFYYDNGGRLKYQAASLGSQPAKGGGNVFFAAVTAYQYNAHGDVIETRIMDAPISTFNSSLLEGGAAEQIRALVESRYSDARDSLISASYNQLGLLALSIDAEQARTEYIYDQFGDLRFKRVPLYGEETRTEYATYSKRGEVQFQRVTDSVGDMNLSTYTSYDAFGRVISFRDRNRVHNTTEYLNGGREIVTRDPMNRRTRTTYDAFGRVLTKTDNAERTTTTVYRDTARLTEVTTPENVTVSTLRNRRGQALRVTDDNGRVTHYNYDRDGNLLSATDGENNVTRHTYDRSGRLVDTVDGEGNIVRLTYDVRNNVIQRAVDPDGLNLRTRYGFDTQGRQNLVIEGYGTADERRTQYRYDRNGRLTQEIVDPGGLSLSTRYIYNAAGDQIRVERGTEANPDQQVTVHSYDSLNRKIQTIVDPRTVSEGLGLTTQYRYDANGNLTRVIDANGNSTWMIYNDANEQVFQVNALGEVKTTERDSMGRVYHERAYRLTVDTSGWAEKDVVTIADITLPAVNIEDRRTVIIYDEMDRVRFELNVVDSQHRWQVFEYRYDRSGNRVASIRFDQFMANDQVAVLFASGFSARTVISLLTNGLGYRDLAWGNDRTTLGESKVTHYAYDSANRLRFTVDGEGGVVETRYDRAGNVTESIAYAQPLQINSTSVYSEARIAADVRLSSHLDRVTFYSYDKANRQVTERTARVAINSSGGTFYQSQRVKQRNHYNALSEVVRHDQGVIERSGGDDFSDLRITRYAYDKAGRLRFTVDARGYVKEQRYEDGLTYSDQTIARVTYNIAYANTLGAGSSYSESGIRSRLRLNADNDRTSEFRYDRADRVKYELSPEADIRAIDLTRYTGKVKTRIRYDGLGQVLTREEGIIERASGSDITNGSRITRYEYNAAGRLTRTILPGVYDNEHKRVIKHAGSAANRYFERTIDINYDTLGNAVSSRTRVGFTGAASDYLTEYTAYDRLGRAIFNVDVMGYVAGQEYDAAGNLVKETRYSRQLTAALPSRGYWLPQEVAANMANDSAKREAEHVYDSKGQRTRTLSSEVHNRTSLGTRYQARPETQYVYNTFGQVLRERVRVGTGSEDWRNTHYFYDTLGRRVMTIDPAKYVTYALYSANGDVTQNTEYARSLSSSLSINYSDSISTQQQITLGTLRFVGSAVDHQDRVTRYRYDTLGQMTSVTQVQAIYRDEVRDSYIGWTEEQTADLRVSSMGYNAFGERIHSVDALSNITNYQYNRLGQVTLVSLPGRFASTNDTALIYNPFANSRFDRLYQAFDYDAFGNKVYEGEGRTIEDASGFIKRRVRNHYDLVGNLVRQSDRDGGEIHYQYDARGQRIRQTQSVNVQENRFYHFDGYSYTMERRFEYDGLGRQTAELTVYLNGSLQTGSGSRYNAFGEIADEYRLWGAANQSSDQLTRRIASTSTYDNAGRLVTKRDNSGFTHFGYDLRGLNTYVEQRGSTGSVTGQRVSRYYYDLLGRKAVEELPSFKTYGTSGASLATRQESGQTIPDDVLRTPSISRAYDRWGNVIRARDALNNYTYYKYDQNNRLIEERGPSAAQYRWSDSVLQVYSGRVTKKIGYDRAGRQVIESARAYNSLGQEVDYQHTSRKLNRAGHVIEETDASRRVTRYVYDIFGQQVGVRKGFRWEEENDTDVTEGTLITTLQSYNKNGQMTRRTLLDQSAGQLTFTQYEYDRAGRKYAEGVGGRGTDGSVGLQWQYFGYDERGLLNVKTDGRYRRTTYMYDQLGNKTVEAIVGNMRGTADQLVTSLETQNSVYSSGDYNLGRLIRKYFVAGEGAIYTGSNYRGRPVQPVLGRTPFVAYYYTRFGELQLERYMEWNHSLGRHQAGRDVQYSYYANGLLKDKQDQKVGGAIRNIHSRYYYDIRGLKVHQHDFEHDANDRTAIGTNVQTSVRSKSEVNTSYRYDNLGRIIEVDSYATQFRTPTAGLHETQVADLIYKYDVWGNRLEVATGRYSQAKLTDEYYHRATPPPSYNVDRRIEGSHVAIYTYDKSGRMLSEQNGDHPLKRYSYDFHGRLASENSKSTLSDYTYNRNSRMNPNFRGYFRERSVSYTYHESGQLATEVGSERDVRHEYGGPAYGASGIREIVERNKTIDKRNEYDYRGFRTLESDGSVSTTNQYYDSGLVRNKDVSNDRGDVFDFQYAVNGDLLRYRVRQDGHVYTYRNHYVLINHETKVSYTSVSSSQGGSSPSTTYNFYDKGGRLIKSQVEQGSGRLLHKYFSYNADSQIIGSLELLTGSNLPRRDSRLKGLQQTYLYSNGQQLADIGDAGVHTGYNVFNKGGDTPSGYVLQAGDTLMAIAQRIYGDASLWYVIANANSFSHGPNDRFTFEQAGMELRLPNIAQSRSNKATSFKPYNPNEIIGDLSPSPTPAPPPPGSQACGIIATIIVVAISAVVTVVTSGAAAAALGPALGALASTGGALIGGAAGAFAGQIAGNVLGVQQGFDGWGILAGALTSAAGAGAGALAGSLTKGSSQLVSTGVSTFSRAAASTATRIGVDALRAEAQGQDFNINWASTALNFGMSAASDIAFELSGIGQSTNNSWLKGLIDLGRGVEKAGYSYLATQAVGNRDERRKAGDNFLYGVAGALGSGFAMVATTAIENANAAEAKRRHREKLIGVHVGRYHERVFNEERERQINTTRNELANNYEASESLVDVYEGFVGQGGNPESFKKLAADESFRRKIFELGDIGRQIESMGENSNDAIFHARRFSASSDNYVVLFGENVMLEGDSIATSTLKTLGAMAGDINRLVEDVPIEEIMLATKAAISGPLAVVSDYAVDQSMELLGVNQIIELANHTASSYITSAATGAGVDFIEKALEGSASMTPVEASARDQVQVMHAGSAMLIATALFVLGATKGGRILLNKLGLAEILVPRAPVMKLPKFNPFENTRFGFMAEVDKRKYLKNYVKQLSDQRDAINSMTVKEFWDARTLFKTYKRNPLANAEQKNMRDDLQSELSARFLNQARIEHTGMSERSLARIARNRVRRVMKQLDALHEPDMVAGGFSSPAPVRMGNKKVNTSIGGSWPSRMRQIDLQIEKLLYEGHGNHLMNIQLEIETKI